MPIPPEPDSVAPLSGVPDVPAPDVREGGRDGSPSGLDRARLVRAVREGWRDEVIPALVRYIEIPAVSATFDPAWAAHGHLDAATALVAGWCAERRVPGLRVEVARLPGRSPVVVCEAPATRASLPTTLLYGHLDKQPEMVGWRDGLGPWTPLVDGDRLYGRGGADDGYSAFAGLLALEAIHDAGGAHGRCVVLIEASEESGSPDLPAYVELLADRIGSPELVVCLDSGCATYDRLWVTTSLRGLCRCELRVEVLREGVHSGSAGGIVPSSWRILRQLLSRVEDETSGQILLPELRAEVPESRRVEARETAAALGPQWAGDAFPFSGSTQPLVAATAEALLARTWGASLEVIGIEGVPAPEAAGNVLRPATTALLALRLPPTVDAQRAADALREALTGGPPHGAAVSVRVDAQSGWEAPTVAPWLHEALGRAAHAAFARPTGWMGEGGTIPFMGMLGRRFPDAQFVITGVLGPESNADGPNEFLHLPTAEGLTTAIALLLDDQATRRR